MTTQQFSIQQHVFEIDSADRAGVHELQNRISRLVNDRLTGKMSACFSRIIPEDILLTIDQLSYDIGEVSSDELEEEIEERLIRAIEDDLLAKLRMLENSTTGVVTGMRTLPVATGRRELLEHFLLTGMLPWWSGSPPVIGVDHILDELYQHNRDDLRSMLLRTGKKEQVRKRMVYQFPETGIKQIITTVEPAEAAYVFQSHHEIMIVQQQRQLVKAEMSDLSRAVWLFMLNYLLVEQSGQFSRKMFIRSNLVQLAATYNIAYHDILHIFYDALEGSGQKNLVSLKKFIREIVEEETVGNADSSLFRNNNSSSPGNRKVPENKLDILQYFISFDSLPPEVEQLSDTALRSFLMEVVEQYPEQAKAIFLKSYSGQRFSNHFYSLFDAAGLRKLFTILFPTEELRFSAVISMLQALQGIHPFVQLSGSELSRELWKYTVEARLMLNNNAVAEEHVIKYLIDNLDKEYRQNGSQTWNLLYGSIERSSGNSIRHQQSFKDIEKVVTEKAERNADKGNDMVFIDRGPGISSLGNNNEKKLKDVLRFVLQYGNMPWWGQEFYHLPVTDMMLALHHSDKAAYVLLFRQAMQLPQMKKRFLDHLPVETINELLGELPGGQLAAVQLGAFADLLQNSRLLQYYNTPFIQKSLFAIAAEIFAGTGYQLFSGSFFYKEAITRLASVLQMKQEDFVGQMVLSVTDNQEVPVSRDVMMLLKASLHLMAATQLPEAINTKWRTLLHQHQLDDPTDIHLVAEVTSNADELQALEYLLPGMPGTDQERFTFLYNTLEYFLTWNRLPVHINIDGIERRTLLLKTIVQYLFAINSTSVEALLLKPSAAQAARLYVTEIFAGSRTIREHTLFTWLTAIAARAVVPDSQDSVIFNLPVSVEPESRRGFDLRDFFLSDRDMPETMHELTIYDRVFATLEYFLVHNKLPENIQFESKWRMDLLLKEMAVFLFQKDAEAFKRLLDRQADIKAKVRLYDQFVRGSDIVTEKIAGLFYKKREGDIVQFMQLTGISTEREGHNTIKELLNRLLKGQWETTDSERMTWLLYSRSFAQMVLDKGGIQALCTLTEHKMYGREGSGSVINDWYWLIQNAIDSSFLKVKLIELLSRFNIDIITGTVIAGTYLEYTNVFLHYIWQHVGDSAKDVYTRLFTFLDVSKGHLSRTDSHLLLQAIKSSLLRKNELDLVAEQQALAITKDILREKNMHVDVSLDKDQSQQQSSAAVEDLLKDEKELLKENKNGFYARNAGIILFHPFLETFFSRTGLMEKGVFINEETRQRAVLLLQYLATEKTEHEEHELVLNKILCNVPLTMPVPVRFTPSELEVTVCAELFAVVIQRWPKMKNASSEGLRTSLILRNGVIRHGEEEWNMRVEQRSYDVILQTLPWAFGFIKTKWMDKPLTTEWI